MDCKASISSDTFIVASSDARPAPDRPATTMAVTSGPSSRNCATTTSSGTYTTEPKRLSCETPRNPMMRPTSMLAALVTRSAFAPISWSSLGSDRQSTELGRRIVFGNAMAQRPMKSSACVSLPGSSAAAAPIRSSTFARAWLRRAIRSASAIEGDQARRFRVALFHDVRASARPRPVGPAIAPAGLHRCRRCDRDAQGRPRPSGTLQNAARHLRRLAPPPSHGPNRTDQKGRGIRDALLDRLGLRRS